MNSNQKLLRGRNLLNISHVIKQTRNLSTVGALRIVWLVAVVWYELGVFFWSVARCSWPDQVLEAGIKHISDSKATIHVLLVADPQILDGLSYPDRPPWLGALSQVVADLNLRKSWWAIRKLLLRHGHNNGADGNSDAVVFLGDMMDNGRLAYDDTEYREYFERFKSIFTIDPFMRVYYIPGNHDVGLGASRRFSPHTRTRYKSHFGSLNYKISLANHTLVMLDAPGLVEEDYRRASAGQSFESWTPRMGGPIDFINKFAGVGSNDPVVLFSHIPLFRPETAPCGPLRERGSIRRGSGFGYQNTLGRQTSEYILKNVQPSIIFSGDDHDYCEYTHSIPLISEGPNPKIEYVHEVTVKSLSMAMGIRKPGFQLLSLTDPSRLPPGSPSHANALCLLPDQISIYLSRYVPLLLLGLCVLAISTFRKLRARKRLISPYALDINTDGSSSTLLSPESRFATPLTGRMPNSSTSGAASLAPTYRASSATFPPMPNTPDFTVSSPYQTPSGRVATPGLLSAPPAGLSMTPEDAELGYMDHEDYGDDEESQYAERRTPDDVFDTPALEKTPRRRRLAWSWTFILRERRRRITISVPPLLEQAFFKLIGIFRQRYDQGRLCREKKGINSSRREGAVRIFGEQLLAATWPPVLVFIFVSIFMFT